MMERLPLFDSFTFSSIAMMYLTIMKRKPLCVIYISMVALCCQVHSFSQIRVCQNKDCIKQSEDGNLIQMLTDLIPPQEGDKINIESCGCLSNCGKGPNVSIKSDGGVEERVFNNVKDVQTAAAILDVGAGIDSPIALMVAAEMIAQANRSKVSFILLSINFHIYSL
jgi:predicted metal-binding protein